MSKGARTVWHGVWERLGKNSNPIGKVDAVGVYKRLDFGGKFFVVTYFTPRASPFGTILPPCPRSRLILGSARAKRAHCVHCMFYAHVCICVCVCLLAMCARLHVCARAVRAWMRMGARIGHVWARAKRAHVRAAWTWMRSEGGLLRPYWHKERKAHGCAGDGGKHAAIKIQWYSMLSLSLSLSLFFTKKIIYITNLIAN